ncbi:ATP-binding protein [Dethiobacter alkaliphilus]|uniref:ATP-binding protein n=1 Tax=Dethiobacter alkaliphilus TaxID=427926 RepID=UPI0002F52FFA|nr:P-loop NTPase [Dethiobacter alkaliphilus]
MKIAVSGKGGVGKTTFSANLIRALANRDYTVYAVDADPDVSLGATLGLPADELAELRPIIEMKAIVDERSGGEGAFFTLNPKVDDLIDDFVVEQDKIKFLRMGSVKQGGTACYCKENSFLYAVLSSLLLDKEDMVVMDMSAGIEHLTRGTSRGVDMIIIVTEPTRVSAATAKVVQKLAKELGIRQVKILVNKVRTDKEKEFVRSQFTEDELLGMISFDDAVLENAIEEESKLLEGSGVMPGIDEIVEKILGEVKD